MFWLLNFFINFEFLLLTFFLFFSGHYYPCTAITIMYIICKYSLIRVTGYASCNVHKLLVCFILYIMYYDLQFEINYLLTTYLALFFDIMQDIELCLYTTFLII